MGTQRGRFDLRQQRMVCCEVSQALHGQREAESRKPSRVAPYSCLIGAMSNRWQEGCEEAVKEMAIALHHEGYTVRLYEEFDACYQPYDALGTMRNRIYMEALAGGYEWLCYVDNDIRPQPDALLRLIRREVPIVSPVVRYPGGETFQSVAQSSVPRNQGLVMVDSVLLSMFVCRPQVFMPWHFAGFWENPIGATEEHHWDKMFWGTGHRPFLDTDVEIEVTEKPHFPLQPGKAPSDGKARDLWVPQ